MTKRHDDFASAPRVLVADDSRDTADVYTWLLESAGCRVSTAYDGLTALAMARAGKPDLMIVNFMMPQLTGLDITRELRESRSRMKIVIASGVEEFSELERRALEAGADMCVRQPWEPAELLRCATALLTSARAR